MKKALSCLTAALIVLFMGAFVGPEPTYAAGEGRLPEALVDTATALAGYQDARFLRYDVNGDGASELATLYCENGMTQYCRLFGVDASGNAVEIFSNGGEILAGSPGFFLVELPFEGADRLAYYYHNFNNVACEQYTIIVPDADGTIVTRSLQAEVDVAGLYGYSLYWQDGAEISAEQFHAVHDNAVVLSTEGENGLCVTLDQLLAEQAAQPEAPQEPPLSADAVLLEKTTTLTDLGATIDEPNIYTWRTSRIAYTYGDQGQLVREDLFYDGQPSTVTEYRYDENGCLTGSTETWNGGGAWTQYVNDDAGRRIGEVRSVGPEGVYTLPLHYWKYTYDEAGRKVREEYGSANSIDLDTFTVIEPDETADFHWSEEFYYNDDGVLDSSYAQDGGLSHWRYYDSRGNIAVMEDHHASDGSVPYRVTNCENTYDDAGRLIHVVQRLSDGQLLGEITYTYGDAAGQDDPGEDLAGGVDGGDENYELLRAYWMENVGLDCCGVFGDVDRDGQEDFIYMDDRGDSEMVYGYVLTVKEGAVRSILVEEGTYFHAGGFANLFVRVNADGTADLIDYTDAMYQGYGQCCYSVYHLDENGNRVETDQIAVSSNDGVPPTQEQLDQFNLAGEALISGTTCLYTAGLDGLVSFDGVIFPQVTTNLLFDMGLY